MVKVPKRMIGHPRMIGHLTRVLILIAFLLLKVGVQAQTIHPSHLIGFASGSLAPELNAEDQLVSKILPDTLRTIVQHLSAKVHVAGTEAQAETRDYVLARMKRAGIETTVYPYDVYLPHAISASLEMTLPRRRKYTLRETRFRGEPASFSYPWVNGFSASGKVHAAAVYVNYGLKEDYRLLDSLHIETKGKIAIARYGKSYRGIKAKLAEEHGAKGLLLFSDPSSDGFDAGEVYPNGPMRPGDGVQRGSIYNGHGDPTTPGYPSLAGARHVDPNTIYRVPTIPVVPISSFIAEDILSKLAGRDIPESSWQGGFGFRYHVGSAGVEETESASPVMLTLHVSCDTARSTIWNTVSTIKGTVWPNEWVIIGGHRDAWCDGTEDNAAGCASVIAAAEAFGALAHEGVRPKRSVMFITWDAEEWGLIGSTEWVEQMEKPLLSNAVIYINQDMCATGPEFSASSDPTLHELLYECTASILDPAGGSILGQWVKRTHPFTLQGEQPTPEIGVLGGGSDFGPFYNHLGIPCSEHGFSGKFGQYHSDHDNYYWTSHFGDSSFRYHAASSRIAALEALRVANADILPYNFEELGRFLKMTSYPMGLHAIRTFSNYRSSDERSSEDEINPFDLLDSAETTFRIVAAQFDSVRDAGILSESSRLRSIHDLLQFVNQEMRQTFFQFIDLKGLTSDAYDRNMLVDADPDNGYADLRLPAITIAFQQGNEAVVNREVDNLTTHVKSATEILRGIVSRAISAPKD